MDFGDNLHYGFIAEDVLEVAPHLVYKEVDDPEGPIALYYYSILGLAVAEIQKLRKELDELKSNFNIK